MSNTEHNITRLNIYDFDDTLFRVGTFAGYRALPKKFHEEVKQHPYNFYDHPESLNEDHFEINLIQNISEDLYEESGKDHSYNMLVTHRVEQVRPQVEALLRKHNLFDKFDSVFFLGRKSPKSRVMEFMIDKYPNLGTIRVFEDSISQAIDYFDKFKKVNVERAQRDLAAINCKVVFVGHSRIVEINDIEFGEKQRVNLKL